MAYMKGHETPKGERRRRWRRWPSAFLLLALAWLGGLSHAIGSFGGRDGARPADCAIVLGAAVHGSRPSPVFEERLRHAVALYQRGMVSRLVFTGGRGEGAIHAESEVGARYAISAGVRPADILIEAASHTTLQNLVQAQALMRRHVLSSAVIVSDPLHLKRASLMAADLGMDATASPTPSTRYRSLSTQLPFLGRELFFLHYYWLTGQ